MERDIIHKSHIVIVDDQYSNVTLLERILHQGGYNRITSFTDARKALAEFTDLRPDLVALDLRMPNMDGFAFLKQVRSRIKEDEFIPIVILTADHTQTAERQALKLGAKDFLTKPLDLNETLLRIYNLLETRWLHVRLQENNRTLEDRVRERTAELESAQAEILQRLALASEFRDDNTGQHTQRVGQLAGWLGRAIGLPEDRAALLQSAAPLHDIGKIGVPDQILLKPLPLTDPEKEQVRRHTDIGAKILSGSRFEVLQMAERIALYHHERWDGNGYCGLRGEEIPLEARIVCLADAFDVITHSRPYKEEQSLEVALDRIRMARGTQFDPQLVDALCTQPVDGLERLGMVLQEQSEEAEKTPHSVLSET
jgi:response regulator RpfG family c-di-GMP phosphodiesterase